MRRPPRVAVLIAVLAASAAWVAIDLRSPQAPAAARSAAQAAAPGSPEPKQKAEIPGRSTFGKFGSDPFSTHSWVTPSKPRAVLPVQSAPVAPPLPYRFAGQFYRDSGVEVYVARGEEIFPVKEGDTLDGQYKVESVAESEVRFLHVPSGTRQVMQFSALREQDLAAQSAPARPGARASVAPTTAASPSPVAVPSGSNPAQAKAGPAQLRW